MDDITVHKDKKQVKPGVYYFRFLLFKEFKTVKTMLENISCIRCVDGMGKMVKNGFSVGGKQRYKCRICGMFTKLTTREPQEVVGYYETIKRLVKIRRQMDLWIYLDMFWIYP